MDCCEEQQMELEALEALFIHDGEFVRLSDTAFRLVLVAAAEGQAESRHRLSATLQVEYTPGYPESELPRWSLSASKGCEGAALEALRRDVEAEMEKQRGNPMMYNIAEFIQMVNKEAPDEAAGDDEQEQQESHGEEEGGKNGVPVTSSACLADKNLCAASERCTKEKFDYWADKFREEMIARGIWLGSCGQQQRGVLTGRQLFERDASLATADTAEAERDAEEADENFRKDNTRGGEGSVPSGSSSGKQPAVTWRDESLFTADDLDDLPSD